MLLLAVLALLSWQCRKEAPTSVRATSFYETELFRAIQMQRYYPDSKTFVDMERDTSWQVLAARYLLERKRPGFDLRKFLRTHFEEAPAAGEAFQTDTTRSMAGHINAMWEVLRRGPDPDAGYSSRIPLPHPYVVPGGRFREIYYWDSYFTMIGLVRDGERELAADMLANFAHLIDSLGFIPNGTRDYYLSRSQPPFFSLMVSLLSEADPSVRDRYLDQVAKEYAYWMHGTDSLNPGEARYRVVRLQGDTLANRYWDSGRSPRPESYAEDVHLAESRNTPEAKAELYANLRAAAASGWDFSSRWYEEEGLFASTQTIELLPVDLNALLYGMEVFLAEGYASKGDEATALQMRERSERRAAMIRDRMWDPEAGFFVDYDFADGERSDELTLAGVFPLYFGLADTRQAEAVRDRLMDDFLAAGGLLTTLKDSGQQWDAPNGWAPLQWMAVVGLGNYGYQQEARTIARRWLRLNEKVYADTGKMMEKYNVQDTTLLSGGGEYPTQDGFGWTNGVAIGFRAFLEAEQP